MSDELAVRAICKQYSGVQAVADASFTVRPGEVHGLVGPTVSHSFPPDGFYDHAEPRPEARRPEEAGASTIENNPAGENKRRKPAGGLDVGPADGTACVPGA